MAELYRVFIHFYGAAPLPDDDAGRDDLRLVFQVISTTKNAAERMRSIAITWAPWMPPSKLEDVIADVAGNPRRFKADTIAARLGITAATRTQLGLRTIGAIDKTAKQRAEDRRLFKMIAKRQRRSIAGALSRSQYEEKSTQRRQPWTALGISRRTWYRRVRS